MRRRQALTVLLLFCGCSSNPSTDSYDASVADASGEGTDADWICPGHRDPAPCAIPGKCGLGITVETPSVDASLASIRVLAGSCAISEVVSMAGEQLKDIDGGFPAVPALVAFIAGDCTTSSECALEVSFVDGSSEVIVANYFQEPPVLSRFCLDNSNCCHRDQYVEAMNLARCALFPSEFLLGLPPARDGGTSESSS